MKNKRSKLKVKVFLLFAVFLLNASNVLFAQQRISLADAIKRIEQRFNANLSYEHQLLQGKYVNSDLLQGKSLEEVLKKVLYPNQLVFLYVDEHSYSIVKRTSDGRVNGNSADQKDNKNGDLDRVVGVVKAENGKPIPFANIWVKNSRKGTKSDEEGRFLLSDLKSSDALLVTAVGFEDVNLQVGDKKQFVVTMKEEENILEEIITSTGYQKISKERVTGAVSVVTAKDLEKIPTANLVQRLEGQVPGLQLQIKSGDRSFSYNNNQLGLFSSTQTVGRQDYQMSIRGVSSIDNETEKSPLVVVDGAITTFDLSSLNPNDVENITFLKDAAAASIYGVRAANGVIVITTKKGKMNAVPRISFSSNFSFSGIPDLGYLKTMNSAQMIAYQEELVQKGLLNSNNVSTLIPNLSLYAGDVAAAAIRLKNNQITQQQYNAFVDPLRQVNNRSQIEKYLMQPMNNQQYNLSISNGTENNSYYYSASYSNESPYSKGDNGKRLTLNMNNSWKLFKIATLSTSLKGAFFRHQHNSLGLNTIFNSGSTPLMPYQLLADNNGNGIDINRINPDLITNLGSGYKDWHYNYLQERSLADNVQKDNNYQANINLEVPIYKGIKGSVMYANERSFSKSALYYDENSFYYRDFMNRMTPVGSERNSIGITDGGILNTINTETNNYTVRGQLSYDALLNHNHDITAIAGSEIRQTDLSQSLATLYGYNRQTGFNTAVNYTSSAYKDITGNMSQLPGVPSLGDRRRRFLSYYGNAAYTYSGKYTLSGSVRYDDYNNFGLDRAYRATPLWSTGGKWNLSKEDFMTSVKWLDQLSLRATYGVNGNITQDVRPFTYIALSESYTNVTNMPYADIIAVANPQLRWEKTYVTNIGADFTLLGNRLYGSVDYYHKSGKDLLYAFPISSVYVGTINSGYLKRNTATMVGKGLDLGLTGVVLKNEDWTADLTANFSYNTNEITDNRFNANDISLFTLSYAPVGIGYLQGYPSDKVFAFRHAGLDKDGLTQIHDREGKVISATQTLNGIEDLKYMGRSIAPYFGSLRTNIRYKQWSAYALVTYQFGNVFVRPAMQNYMTAGRRGTNIPFYDLSADIADRWQKAGDEAHTNVPAVTTTVNGQYSLQRYIYSDINILKGDYIRLREVSLSYALPASLLKTLRLDHVSLTGSVRNLGLIWKANKEGFDPDFVTPVGNTTNLRPVPSYNFAINVNF